MEWIDIKCCKLLSGCVSDQSCCETNILDDIFFAIIKFVVKCSWNSTLSKFIGYCYDIGNLNS